MSDTHSRIIGGREFFVEASDRAILDGYDWRLHSGGYARCSIEGKNVYLHRLILGAGKGEIGDHIDGNPSNNRRSNLRKTDTRGNVRNRRGTSPLGVKGVSVRRDTGYISARIKIDGKRIHLGYFPDLGNAARAYDKAATLLFGEFARLNFPGDINSEAIQIVSGSGRHPNRPVMSPTGFKGVKIHHRDKSITARIKVNGKEIYLGTHKTIERSARAYDVASQLYLGGFARLNFAVTLDASRYLPGTSIMASAAQCEQFQERAA